MRRASHQTALARPGSRPCRAFNLTALLLYLSLWRLLSCDFVRPFPPARRWRFCCSQDTLSYFANASDRLRPYAGGTLGIAIISEIDADLAVPDSNQVLNATDFYDRTGGVYVRPQWRCALRYLRSGRCEGRTRLPAHHGIVGDRWTRKHRSGVDQRQHRPMDHAVYGCTEGALLNSTTSDAGSTRTSSGRITLPYSRHRAPRDEAQVFDTRDASG